MTVIPQFYGEHAFEPATYHYSLTKDEPVSRLVGITTNKPANFEVMTSREYRLSHKWHIVMLPQLIFKIGSMDLFRSIQSCHNLSTILNVDGCQQIKSLKDINH